MSIKPPLLLLSTIILGFSPIYSQDTLTYEGHHFNKSVILSDSLKAHGVKDDGNLVLVPFKYVLFNDAIFDSLASINNCDFKGVVDFSNSSFYSSCSFKGNYENTVRFFNASFFSSSLSNGEKGFTYFHESHFASTAWFIGMQCFNKISFDFTEFDSLVAFDHSVFNEEVSFTGSRFSKNAWFGSTTFYKGVDFSQVTLPDTLNLENVKTEKEIDFTAAFLDSTKNICFVNLVRSDISKIRINYTDFRLFFYGDAKANEITSVYQKLLKKFKDDGFEDSYEKLDIEFQKYKYKISGQWFRSWLQEWWWNFGYNKEYIFKNSFCLLLLFFVINILIGAKFGYNFLIKEVYEVENIEEEVVRLQTKYANKKIKLFFSWLPMIFVYTCMLFFILNLNIKHLRYRHKYALAYILCVFWK